MTKMTENMQANLKKMPGDIVNLSTKLTNVESNLDMKIDALNEAVEAKSNTLKADMQLDTKLMIDTEVVRNHITELKEQLESAKKKTT